MSHGDAFLQAILAEPDDDAPRLIYADWLEERGDPRGAFIRLQCALERLGPTDPPRPDLEDEADELLYQHEEEWTAPLKEIASEWRFRRGFVEDATVAGDGFLARGNDLFNAFPIIRLRIKLNRGQVGAVAASPHLTRLRTIDVASCRLRDRGVQELLASPHLTRVTALGLAGNDLEGPAVRAIVASPLMGRITWLNLKDNGSLGVSAARTVAHAPAAANLQTLNLSSTNIGRAGLRDILTSTSLTSLTSLSLAQIGLHGPFILDGLIGVPVLSRLTAFDLGGFPTNDLTDLLASLASGRLTSLCLVGNILDRRSARSLAESPHLCGLTTLDLGHNSIGSEGLRMLAESPRLARLTVLRLYGNGVRDAGARALAASPYMCRLTGLDLRKNGIGGPGILALAESPNFAHLTTLDLSENFVGLESVRALATSPHLRRLTYLRLMGNRLDGEAAGLLSASPHWSRLSVLDLNDNALGDGGLHALLSSTRLNRLTELSLQTNDIGSRGAESLAAMLADAPRFVRLRKLDLRGNPLGDNERQLLRQRFGERIVIE